MSTPGAGSTPPQTRGFWPRNMWVLLLLALFVAGTIGFGAVHSADQRAQDAQSARIVQLEAEIARAEHRDAASPDDAVRRTLGVDPARVASDSAEIQDLLRIATTWDSGEKYEAARESLKRKYKLTETDDFLTTFMPPSRFNVDSGGRRYYYIDALGLTSQLDSDVEVEVMSVRGTTYRYAVIAEVLASSSVTDAKGTQGLVSAASRKTLVYVTTDSEGRVNELTGFPASGATRTSG